MILFLTILTKLIPLYFMMGLGYIGTRGLGIQKESIGKLLIYIVAPVVIFYGTYMAPLDMRYFSLPIIFYVISSFLAIIFYYISSRLYRGDTRANILAFTAWTGNTGYFWLPVISATLGEWAFSIAVLSILGVVLYENTLGFYLTAKGNFSPRESMMKVLKLPTIYAFLLGLICNVSGLDLSGTMTTMITQFKWVYTVLGMMIIGMGLAGASWKSVDFWFISLTFLAKFLCWPWLIALLIFVDKSSLHIFNTDIYNVMILMSIVPLAANTVAIATELRTHPEKAAVAVLLSTIFALFYIPLIVSLFIS
jgi:malate permease and related proteins